MIISFDVESYLKFSGEDMGIFKKYIENRKNEKEINIENFYLNGKQILDF